MHSRVLAGANEKKTQLLAHEITHTQHRSSTAGFNMTPNRPSDAALILLYIYSRRMCVCVCASLFNASRMWKWLDCRKRSCQASMVYSAQVAKKKRVLFKRRNAMKIIANFFFFKRRECCVAQFSATRCGCTTTRRRRRRARALSFDCA